MRRWGGFPLVIVLGLLCCYGLASVDLYLPALPAVADSFDASASAVQMSLTASVAGFGVGQLFIGPLCDRFGRRRPIVVGLVVFCVFSIGCAVATSLATLVVFRLGQALGGAAGQVAARAVLRDLHEGRTLANLYATVMIVTGLTPLVAPLIGGQLLAIGSSWRTIFFAQALFAVLLLAAAAFLVPESLPAAARETRGVRQALHNYAGLLARGRFLAYALVIGFGVATVFSFVAAASFVLQDIYGLSATAFSLCFAAGAIGLVIASQLSRLLNDVHSRIAAGAAVMVGGGLVEAVGVGAHLGVAVLVLGSFLVWCGFGALSPAAMALAMTDEHRNAGSAAALLGAIQYGIGGFAGPLVGLAGRHSAGPMVFFMLLWSSCVAVLTIWAGRRWAPTEGRGVADTGAERMVPEPVASADGL